MTGKDLAKKLGSASQDIAAVDWDSFPSGDPNIRFRWQDVQGQHVVFLFDTVDRSKLFEQLALLQQLQGFPLPDSDDSPRKWKTYAQEGRYTWGRAHRITVVLPWYRPCQMERTSRWEALEDGAWTNGAPEGRWLDIPFAQSLAALLAAPAPNPPGKGPALAFDSRPLEPLWRPPVTLFFVELHEEAPVRSAVAGSTVAIRMERFVPFFLSKFGDQKSYPGRAQLFVLFPDHGAYLRYFASVKEVLRLEDDHILYINKTRVGDKIKQEQKLYYQKPSGEADQRSHFKRGQHVLIIDDFTNSGSTLFGAVSLVRSLLTSESGQALTAEEQKEALPVSIFVSHLVAGYQESTVAKIRQKLHDLGSCRFYTTDSIPSTTQHLADEPQAEVLSTADFLIDHVR